MARVYAAIPTMYSGVQFRSRLEARWAAFFDIRGTSWQYEPIDLCGYIPDFVIEQTYEPMFYGPGLPQREIRPHIVEVKPGLQTSDLWNATLKCDSSGWDGPGVVVGAHYRIAMGRSYGSMKYSEDGTASLARGWTWYQTGFYPGPSESSPADAAPLSDVALMLEMEARLVADWREAGNRVQWRSPR